MSLNENNLSAWIKKLVCDFVNQSPENSLHGKYKDERAWGEPLIGFSRGDDSFYRKLKEDIGEFYWTPSEIFDKTFPGLKTSSRNLSVISWILPQTEATKLMHTEEKFYPSERWVRSRVYGQEFIRQVAIYLTEELNKNGYKAIAPMLSPHFEFKKSEKYGYASTWSERHTAFVSGLGTFGLCDGLITPVGKAMRCGSIIAEIDIEPSIRQYTNYNEYCLYYSKGICMECVKRCPVNAIDENGHDKIKCREYQRQVIRDYTKGNYGIESSCCGLCQTDIPCESGIPL